MQFLLTKWEQPVYWSNFYSYLLVDCNSHTIINLNRYYLDGSNKNEIFLELPGFSDNIKVTERQTLLVPFNIVKNFSLGEYGLIAEYDLNGNPLRSWHDQNGKVVSAVSQITQYQDKLYLGSLLSDYIATVNYNSSIKPVAYLISSIYFIIITRVINYIM